MIEYTEKELGALKDFRNRVSDANLDWFYGNNYHLMRWLKARDWNVDKAHLMFQKNQEWKTAAGIDGILNKSLSESVIRDFPFQVPGFDDEGNLVVVIPYGRWDVRKLVEGGNKEDILHFLHYNIELAYRFARSRSTVDKISSKLTLVIDLEGFSLRTILHKPTIEFLLEMVQTMEDNYPEILKASFLVNCPKIFEILWTLAKPLLSMRTLNKFQIMGCNSTLWRARLLKQIPPRCLPSHYGGSQITVPNISFYYSRISKMDFSKEELKVELEMNKVYLEEELTKALIDAEKKFQHVVRIPANGGVLRWGFRTDDGDVGFRLFNATGDKAIEVTRADAHKSMQLGTFRASTSGSYVFSFDNSHCRAPKNLYYKIELCEPEAKIK